MSRHGIVELTSQPHEGLNFPSQQSARPFSDTIQARNSLEKMLAHQLTATHAVVMEQIGQVHVREEGSGSSKRLTAIARCLEAYQHGLLTLKKLRQNGSQRIVVQYVNVNEGGQAVIGNIEKGSCQ